MHVMNEVTATHIAILQALSNEATKKPQQKQKQAGMKFNFFGLLGKSTEKPVASSAKLTP